MTKRNKIIIWLSSILTVFIIGLVSCIGVSNGQIRRQQEVQTAKANISKEEQRRVDLFRNMV